MSSRDELRRELFQKLGVKRFPEAPPLNLTVLWRRTFLEYEEWKIEYTVETATTMPAAAGWKVPAYLLIPRGRKKPMPAMICLHQCGGDCVVAKEAVVGKAPWVPTKDGTLFGTTGLVTIDRSDQAYGYELVHEGFVVLAPDSINCGERNIEAIRQPGENRACHQIINPYLGQHANLKRVSDARRAVDLLASLDFVDAERIGAVGHSMGAGVVFTLMACDERVKAGIMGSWTGWYYQFYPLIAPRLLMGLWGEFDLEHQDQAEKERAYDYVQKCYQEANAPDNILIRKLNCGHQFVDEFKWEVYKRLKKHFGILPTREPASLMSIVEEARGATTVWWEDQYNRVTFPEVSGQEYSVMAEREQLVSAIAGLILYLTDRSIEVTLRAMVTDDRGRRCVRFVCAGDPPIPVEPPPASFETLRRVRQILAEHDASLAWEHSGDELVCKVVFAV